MPDYTVKADVDTMLRADNKSAIRSAIGVGTTDAPTFLAQTLTGQSLTGTQATSLLDLSTTWLSTTGTPTAIKLTVTDTASNAASNLLSLDLSTDSVIAQKWRFKVDKAGALYSLGNANIGMGLAGGASISLGAGFYSFGGGNGLSMITNVAGYILQHGATQLWRGSIDHILEQRNGTAKQALRVYNTALSGAPEWAEFDWITSGIGNTLRIGTNLSGTGAARPIDFVTGGVVRMSLPATGGVTVIGEIITSTLANFAWLIRAPDSDTGIRFNGSRTLSISDTINVTAASVGAKLTIRSDAPLQWSSGTNMGAPSPDSGISRNAVGGMLEVNSGTAGVFRDLRVRSVIQQPPATITPVSNGDLVFEATSNTSVTIKLKGSDGTVRSVALTLA